ncbi:DNA alkylation repair enzyme [Streptococcus varani]|uniref:DNA alkylation repair enzyme n=1 Tax=Streptococcus varani TaxID=1608583 RepID=A0A0E4H471_9STRE|nr:DNA alkylation repair protein [Streptococcus varani]CQR24670.1 DNA alkylation repair enzyme [Streptococcus varani]
MLSRELKDRTLAGFYEARNPEQAVQMEAYMRHQFPFLGIQTSKRRQLSKDFISLSKADKAIDWEFVSELWNLEEREFQYFATDYLRDLQQFLTVDDIPNLRQLVISKSWWDTVDSLDRTIGNINFPSSEIDQIMLDWSTDDNFWLRRIAIDHQLLRKDRMKTALLEKILVNNLDQSEFFINKAMGWILRDYSKTNPEWVEDFLNRNRNGLSNLTIREASKYI